MSGWLKGLSVYSLLWKMRKCQSERENSCTSFVFFGGRGYVWVLLVCAVRRVVYGGSTWLAKWSPKWRHVIVLRAAASDALLVMKGPTFCWALKESRKVIVSQMVIFRSIQILKSLLGSLKSRAYFSHLGTNKNLARERDQSAQRISLSFTLRGRIPSLAKSLFFTLCKIQNILQRGHNVRIT